MTHLIGVHWRLSYLTRCETSSFASSAHAEFALFSWVYIRAFGFRATLHQQFAENWTSV